MVPVLSTTTTITSTPLSLKLTEKLYLNREETVFSSEIQFEARGSTALTDCAWINYDRQSSLRSKKHKHIALAYPVFSDR